MGISGTNPLREPWNEGEIVGQKAPFKLKEIWALRVRFRMQHRVRELALFNVGSDSKLRGCDLVALKVRAVCHGDQVATRATGIRLELPARPQSAWSSPGSNRYSRGPTFRWSGWRPGTARNAELDCNQATSVGLMRHSFAA